MFAHIINADEKVILTTTEAVCEKVMPAKAK